MELKMVSSIFIFFAFILYLIYIICSFKSMKEKKACKYNLFVLTLSLLFVIFAAINTIFFVPVDVQFDSVNITDKYDCLRYQCRYGYDYHIVGENGVTYLTDNRTIYKNISVGYVYNFTVESNYNNVVQIRSVN